MDANEQIIALIGGPLDGVCLPLTQHAKTPPSQLFVYYPDIRTWSVYNVEDCGGIISVDVYRLRRGGAMYCERKPNDRLCPMLFERTLNRREAAEIERMGRDVPPEFT